MELRYSRHQVGNKEVISISYSDFVKAVHEQHTGADNPNIKTSDIVPFDSVEKEPVMFSNCTQLKQVGQKYSYNKKDDWGIKTDVYATVTLSNGMSRFHYFEITGVLN